MADLEAALRARDPKWLPKHPMMLAAAGLAIDNSALLLVRDPHGFWSGVGGFIEQGESPEEALIREVREELGVKAEINHVYRPALLWHVDGESSFLLFLYGIRLASREFSPDPKEVTAIRWVGSDEWAGLDMLPWTRAIFERHAAEWLAASS